MISIVDAYTVVKIVVNKEINGNITYSRFNALAKAAQHNVFSNVASRIRRSRAREYRYASPEQRRQDMQVVNYFMSPQTSLDTSVSPALLPADVAWVEEVLFNDRHIEEIGAGKIGIVNNAEVLSDDDPVYKFEANGISIYPKSRRSTLSFEDLSIYYVRYPADPQLPVYVVGNQELLSYDNAASYQDFEMPESFYFEILLSILGMLGISLSMDKLVGYTENETQLSDKQKNDA